MTNTLQRHDFEKQAVPLLGELYASALRLTKQKENAEDLVSEVYTKAWKAIGQFEPGTNLRAWLYKILTNTYINHYRKKKREPAMVELDKPVENNGGQEPVSLYDHLVETNPSPSENPERVLTNHFLDRDMKRAIESLPEEFRLVVVLADVQSFSYQDIAEMLDIPIGTVRSRLWRGRRLLQQNLWEHAVESGVIPNADPAASKGRPS